MTLGTRPQGCVPGPPGPRMVQRGGPLPPMHSRVHVPQVWAHKYGRSCTSHSDGVAEFWKRCGAEINDEGTSQ